MPRLKTFVFVLLFAASAPAQVWCEAACAAPAEVGHGGGQHDQHGNGAHATGGSGAAAPHCKAPTASADRVLMAAAPADCTAHLTRPAKVARLVADFVAVPLPPAARLVFGDASASANVPAASGRAPSAPPRTRPLPLRI